MRIYQKFIGILILIIPILDLIFPAKGLEETNRSIPIIYKCLLIVIFTTCLATSKNIKRILSNQTSKSILIYLIISIFYIFLDDENIQRNISYFIRILFWILTFYIFTEIGLTNNRIFKHQKLVIISLLLITLSIVIRDHFNEDLYMGRYDYSISNFSYNIVRIMPLIMLCCEGISRNILIITALIGTIISFKRGAILLAVATLVTTYLYNLLKRKTLNNRIKILLYLSIFIIIIFLTINEFSNIFSIRFKDFESWETAGSGRGRMFYLMISDFITYPTNLFFGNGYFSTIDFFEDKIGHSIIAHSDFFEFLYNFGLLGIIIFLNIIKSTYNTFKYYDKINIRYSSTVLSILTIITISSLYTNLLFNTEAYYLAISWGYVTGVMSRSKQLSQIKQSAK